MLPILTFWKMLQCTVLRESETDSGIFAEGLSESKAQECQQEH